MKRVPWKRTLLLAFGLAFFAVFLWNTGFSWSVFDSMREPLYLPLAMGLGLILPLVLALRTRVLLAALNLQGPVPTLIRIEYVNTFLSLLPFRLNLPAKALMLERSKISSFESGLSITTFDFLLDTGTVLGITLLGGALFIPGLRVGGLGEAFLLVLGLLLVFFLVPSRVFDALRFRETASSGAKRLWNRAAEFARDVRSAWLRLATRRTTLWVVPLQAVTVLIQVLGAQLLLLSAGVQLPWWKLTVAVYSTAFLGGVIPIPLQGLGPRDAALFSFLYLLGASESVSLYVTLVSRMMGFIVMGIGYAVSLHWGLRGLVTRDGGPASPPK